MTDPVAIASTPIFDPTGPLTDGSTLLEASAGTGKTYTITSLVVRLVAEAGIPLDELLVVTFTRAATSELRDRIRRRLAAAAEAHERALADPSWIPEAGADRVLGHLVTTGRATGRDRLQEQLRRLRTAQRTFDDATISTIHGFCQQTLHHHAFTSDADFDADLVENVDDILEAIVHDLVVRELRTADPDWYAHLRAHQTGAEQLLDLVRRLESEPNLRVLPEISLTDPEQAWARAVADVRDAWRAGREAVVAWLREQCDAGRLRKKCYLDELDDTIALLDAWCSGDASRFPEVDKQAPNYTATELAKRTKDAYVDHPVFAAFERLVDLGGQPATAFKVRFAAQVREQLDVRKQARNVLSFNDLLHQLQQALADPETRTALSSALQQRYAAALIDEFQDTDPVQWAIFETVFGAHGQLFLIGDPKQAIYAFRGADVDTYLGAADTVGREATLAENWRSDGCYVDALNDLFERSPASGGDGDGVLGTPDIHYVRVAAAHAEDRLRWPAATGAAPAALQLVHFPRDGDEHALDTHRVATEVPAQVAADVVRFLNSGATIQDPADGWRPVLPRDVAVLTRTNAQAQAVQAALHEAGVHAVATGGGSVFTSPEARILQRVFDGLLRPHSERDAKSAVLTPLIGVDATTLVTMGERDWDRQLEQLAAWSQTWRDHGVAEVVRRILAAGGRELLLQRPNGERSLTNVLHLLELLHDAERRGRLGPTGLAAWLKERRHDPRQDRDATELRLESDEDAATIVTIHRAKGLEYPVVWCPYLWEESKLFQSEYPNLRFHDPAADGALTLDLHAVTGAPPKDVHKELAKRETWQERLRLLYVALTRAKHRCTVYWGAFPGYGKSPLGHVLHGFSGEETNAKLPADGPLAAQVDALVAAAGGRIGVEVAAGGLDEDERYEPPPAATGPLAAREATRTLDRIWGRTSFTALTRYDDPGGAVPAVRDVDAGADEAGVGAAATGAGTTEAAAVATAAAAGAACGTAAELSTQVPLAGFPRGAAAGSFLHDVLERFDFTRAEEPGALESLVADQLRRHRLAVDDPGSVAIGLRAALTTPLGNLAGDVRLADLSTGDRLNELGFDLPLLGGAAARPDAAIDVEQIAEVFARHAGSLPVLARAADRLRELDRRAVRGFLTGSIDLVFRRSADGRPRYFVVDYKSNWHGDRSADGKPETSTVAHYHPARLAETMLDHHYLLQAHLYLVALHRLLRWRLGDDYRYDRDVGGVLYLFLRGMVGPDTPALDGGGRYGVDAWKAPAGLVDDLDRLFGGEGVA